MIRDLSSNPRKHRVIIAILLALLGFVARAIWLQVNMYNPGRFYLYSTTSAMIGQVYRETGEVGVIDPELTQRYTAACIRAGRLIDPEAFPGSTRREHLRPEYDIEIGLGTLMGVLWSATGHSRFVYIQWLQIFIDVISILLLFYAGLFLFGDLRTASLCGFFYAAFPYQIDLVTFPAPYVWPVYLGIFLVYALARALRNPRLLSLVVTYFLVGVAGGLVSMMRSTAIACAPFVGACTMVWNPYQPSRRRFWLLMAVLLGQLLAMSPLLYRNSVVFGSPFPTRGTLWHTVYTGFGAHDNPWGIVNSDSSTIDRVKRRYPEVEYATPEYEAILKRWSLDLISKHPFWYMRVLLERVALLIVPNPKSLFSWPVAFLFGTGIAGAYRIVRWGRRGWARGAAILYVVLLPMAYFFLSVVPIYVPQRVYVQAGYVPLLVLSAALFAREADLNEKPVSCC